MTIRSANDGSLIHIWVCRHMKQPTVGFDTSTSLCSDHNGIPDCLMEFIALSWLTDIAQARPRRWESDRRSMFAREQRKSEAMSVRACRICARVGNRCDEHGEDTDIYVSASFIAGYTKSKELWQALRTELLGGRLSILLTPTT